MKLTLLSAAAVLALAATPAFAQLAGSGNLISTQSTQPTWPGVNHQSTTMIAAGGGTRGVLYNVNGGDIAPGVNQSNIVPDPNAVSSHTQSRSVGSWVEVGAQSGGLGNGATVRADVSNGLGTGPTDTYRGVNVNTPSAASGVVSTATNGGNPSTGNLGGGNLAGSALASNLTGKLK